MTPLEALTRIQTAIARYLNPSDPMDAKEFIDEVLAAGDDREVVRAVREDARELDRLRSLLAYAVEKLNGVQDDGPEGEGWQSKELSSWIDDARAALKPTISAARIPMHPRSVD